MGSHQCSMSFGFIQTEGIETQFKALCKFWPSSYHAEVMGFLSAILTCNNNSLVEIYTDSQSLIDMFNTMKEKYFTLTIREKFKINSQILSWSIILEIINIKNLSIRFSKVKAHSGDKFNEKVDKLISTAHGDLNLMIQLKIENMDNLLVIPKWNNIVIDKNIRGFLKTISNTQGFEQFFNQDRNFKYRKININWKMIFDALQSDMAKEKTDFSSSRKKANKVKLMMEEIPTIEQMKKLSSFIYQHKLCPRCQNEEETFNHVWTCPNISYIMDDIVRNIKNFLIDITKENNITNISINIKDISQLDIWKIDSDQNQFTFIDLIKGFIPLCLTTFINQYTRNSKNTSKIIIDLREEIYRMTFSNIWQERCNLQHEIEIAEGITKQVKVDSKQFNIALDIEHFINQNNIQNSLEGIKNNIYFGSSVMGFMIHVNYVDIIYGLNLRPDKENF
ncbi:hypothetical protein C1645_835979 [Glomus cerebriforme]|uniref:RNase H type-1 domain-containing protein n=1 Tax=Glomus cerebriforme TaxID=658196 RepID=A0A397SCK2_9GLOM|nr:hypothetical protein C1645_835979 [Glomus cerebriforme]